MKTVIDSDMSESEVTGTFLIGNVRYSFIVNYFGNFIIVKNLNNLERATINYTSDMPPENIKLNRSIRGAQKEKNIREILRRAVKAAKLNFM